MLFIIWIGVVFQLFIYPYGSFGETTKIPDSPIPGNVENAAKRSFVSPRRLNPIHMLVVFTKFKGEAPGVVLAPDWADKIFDGDTGSVPHYYDEISFGQIKVSGEYLSKRYELPHDATYYIRNLPKFSYDVISLIDEDPAVNLSLYDNDGPDGIPGSSDDDSYVDFLVLVPMSRPYDFIKNIATGNADLSLSRTYYTKYRNTEDISIKLDRLSGCVSTSNTLNTTIGTICHEYAHHYGSVDFYDTNYSDDETDSAGIGCWGLMGLGALGWTRSSTAIGPNAYTRMVLGSVGINNSNLVDIYGIHRGIRLSGVGREDGKVFRIWAGDGEYFLLENRRNDNLYCERDIPQNGLFIWHINEKSNGNTDENNKLCDLECADGKYLDAGYPLGKFPDPINGSDNLDFWAHNDTYTEEHNGNLGDVTDVYDGIVFTRFGSDTNPNSYSKITKEPTGIEIFNIHPDGDDMVFNINSPPITDWGKNKFPLIGIAFQRFNISYKTDGFSEKRNVLYHISYDDDEITDVLVNISDTSMTVDDLTFLDRTEQQKTIEQKIVSEANQYLNAQIIRENITIEKFQNEIAEFEVTLQEIAKGDYPGAIRKISLISENQSHPGKIELNQNYPNPFNSQTVITYNLETAQEVSLEVFNIIGQRIKVIERGFENAGAHAIHINADGMSSGIYFYRVRGKTVSETRKLLLVR